MKLNNSIIRVWIASKPENAKLWDGRGLYLHIRQGGTPTWRIKYRDSGREKVFTVGPYPLVSLASARETLAEFEKHRLVNKYPWTTEQNAGLNY